MKFGVNTFIWTESFTRENFALLPSIKDAGFDGIEVSLFDPATFAAADIRRGLDDHGLECTICSVVGKDVNIISDNAATRSRASDHMKRVIESATEVGAKIVAGPLYSPVGYLPGRRRTTDEWRWAVECYQELGPVLAAHGVTIAIEPLNRFETYFLNTAADAVALCDQIDHPHVGILFDTFHANIEEKNIAAAYRTVGRHLKHVHTCENDRG
ncbi:MAG: sugar phosphate isomerase/epimerase family protein, partial [Bryobacteraceae bacterium]